MAVVDEPTEFQKAVYKYMWTDNPALQALLVGGLHYEKFPDNKAEENPFSFYEFIRWTSDRSSCSKSAEGVIRFWFKDKTEDNNGNKKSSTELSQIMAEFHERLNDCESFLLMDNLECISIDDISQSRKIPKETIANRFEGYLDYKFSLDRK